MSNRGWERRSADEEEADVNLFKEYLRIDTRHPKPDFAKCEQLYRKWAEELGAEFQIVECVQGWPNYILSIVGKNPELPSLLMACHTDVVPVKAEFWTALPPGETPFSAYESPDGKIYARGSQDMKVVGAGEVCALRALKKKNGGKLEFARSVHLVFLPDEEVGGSHGMARLVHTEEFKRLNVGLALDEGLAHDANEFCIFYGERSPLWVTFSAVGPMGHGAKLIENTAADRLARVVERMTKLRDENIAKLKAGSDLGELTTFNLNAMKSGVSADGGQTYAVNVIPRDGSVTFDVRLGLPDFHKVTKLWQQWCEELDVTVKFENGSSAAAGPSPYSPTNTAWFRILKDTIASFGAEVTTRVFIAATDSRYLRRVNIPSYGFSAMRWLPSLLHDHNEYCPRITFLEGVAVYSKIIPALANATGDLSAVVGGKL